MGMITLKEYAERLGKNPVVARQKAQRGTFQTARKIGRDWFIDEDEPYEDARIKTGDYIGFKYGYQYHKQRKAIKEARLAAEAAAAAAAAEATAQQQETSDADTQQPEEETPQAPAE
jgi:hypothetical protein